MKLFIFRHGHSPTVGEAGVTRDADRPISEEGRQDIARMAQLVLKKGGKPEIILASPLKRAQQTAEELSRVLKPKGGVKVYQPLANQISGEDLADRLKQDAAKFSELLAVGHQPQLGDMVFHLIMKSVEIRPGGSVAIELGKDGRAALLWSQNP